MTAAVACGWRLCLPSDTGPLTCTCLERTFKRHFLWARRLDADGRGEPGGCRNTYTCTRGRQHACCYLSKLTDCRTRKGAQGPEGRRNATHTADHGCLLVGAGAEQGAQDGLQVLRDVGFRVQQQYRQQLRRLHPGPHHPVGDVVTDGGKDLGEVSDDQLPAAQPRAAPCGS